MHKLPSKSYDAIVIGSGFGGSVSALRLAEKGYRVAVLEQGRRAEAADLEANDGGPRKLFWMPALGLKGFFTQHFFRRAGFASDYRGLIDVRPPGAVAEGAGARG